MPSNPTTVQNFQLVSRDASFQTRRRYTRYPSRAREVPELMRDLRRGGTNVSPSRKVETLSLRRFIFFSFSLSLSLSSLRLFFFCLFSPALHVFLIHSRARISFNFVRAPLCFSVRRVRCIYCAVQLGCCEKCRDVFAFFFISSSRFHNGLSI